MACGSWSSFLIATIQILAWSVAGAALIYRGVTTLDIKIIANQISGSTTVTPTSSSENYDLLPRIPIKITDTTLMSPWDQEFDTKSTELQSRPKMLYNKSGFIDFVEIMKQINEKISDINIFSKLKNGRNYLKPYPNEMESTSSGFFSSDSETDESMSEQDSIFPYNSDDEDSVYTNPVKTISSEMEIIKYKTRPAAVCMIVIGFLMLLVGPLLIALKMYDRKRRRRRIIKQRLQNILSDKSQDLPPNYDDVIDEAPRYSALFQVLDSGETICLSSGKKLEEGMQC